MKLINTDGMALIGPGSEWFWTALSGIVLGVTFIAIYRQLRLQVSAGANDQAGGLERDWLGERLARARLAVLMAIEADPTAMTLPRGSARAVGHFWERVGWLVRAGHMDGRVVHETFGDVSLWWTWLAPFTHRLREEQGDPQIGEHFEWLAGEMDLMTRQQGFFPAGRGDRDPPRAHAPRGEPGCSPPVRSAQVDERRPRCGRKRRSLAVDRWPLQPRRADRVHSCSTPIHTVSSARMLAGRPDTLVRRPRTPYGPAVSGIVLAVTFLAIYRQLRLQRSQGAVEQIDAFTREWNSERFLSCRLNLLVALQDGADPAHVPDAVAGTLSNYWEAIGTLARAGHLDRRLLWDNHGNSCQLWWGYLGPYCRATRARMEDPFIYVNFEWLNSEMDGMDRAAGTGVIYNEAVLTAMLDGGVNNTRERIRIEQSLRTVIIASPEALPAVPPATIAAADG